MSSMPKRCPQTKLVPHDIPISWLFLRRACQRLFLISRVSNNGTLVMRALEPVWTTKPETASRLRGRIRSIQLHFTPSPLRSGFLGLSPLWGLYFRGFDHGAAVFLARL